MPETIVITKLPGGRSFSKAYLQVGLFTNRPTAPLVADGMTNLYFGSDNGSCSFWDGTGWQVLSGGSGGITYAGEWNSSDTFPTNSLATHNGNLFIATDDSTNEEPYLSPDSWALVAGNIIPCAFTGVSNSTTPANIISATIPADYWEDNEKIQIDCIVTGTHNVATPTLDLSFGSDTYSGIRTGYYTAPNRVTIELWRIGSDIYIMNANAFNNHNFSASAFMDTFLTNQYTTYGAILTSINFSTQKDLVITATFDQADAGDSITVLSAKITKE